MMTPSSEHLTHDPSGVRNAAKEVGNAYRRWETAIKTNRGVFVVDQHQERVVERVSKLAVAIEAFEGEAWESDVAIAQALRGNRPALEFLRRTMRGGS